MYRFSASRTGASETERNTAIDAYLAQVVPRYGPDEAGGMLIDGHLGIDDRSIESNLDRVQAELRKAVKNSEALDLKPGAGPQQLPDRCSEPAR